MNNFFRAIIAGYGAKKLGGGCFGTILVFVLIWVALGQCSFSSRDVPAPESYPADRRVCIPVQPELISDLFVADIGKYTADYSESTALMRATSIRQDKEKLSMPAFFFLATS